MIIEILRHKKNEKNSSLLFPIKSQNQNQLPELTTKYNVKILN